MVVSAGGFLLQVVLVVLFVERLGWPLAAGTAAAVEAAILHNWAWHEAWTWRGRGGRGGRLRRLAAFHAANGAISLAGSVICGELLARVTGLPLEARAALAVALTGGINFLAADRLIFAADPPPFSCRPLEINDLT